MPGGVVADGIDDHFAPATVSPRNLGRQTCQRHEGIHLVRVTFAPEPGVHPAHRCSHDETLVITPSSSEQTILGFDHVAITVMRKFRVKASLGLARFAMPDAIRKDDEIFFRIQWLIFSEEFIGEFRPNELRSTAGCSVRYQNRVPGMTRSVFLQFARSFGNGSAIPATFHPMQNGNRGL